MLKYYCIQLVFVLSTLSLVVSVTSFCMKTMPVFRNPVVMAQNITFSFAGDGPFIVHEVHPINVLISSSTVSFWLEWYNGYGITEGTSSTVMCSH